MRRLWAGTVALLAIAAAGCGGGEDDETPAAPATVPTEAPAALSREELIAQGDAICAEVNAAVGTLASTETSSPVGQAADLYSGMVERLKELGAPADDTSGYSEFIAAAEQLDQAESDVGLAVERGEEEGLATAQAEAALALSSFQSAAASYGFEQCGEGPSAPLPGASPEAGPAEEPIEGAEEEEAAPEVEAEETAPETGGAGSAEGGGAGGGATAGGGTEGGGETGGGESSGGIGPG